jgi:hypothetical protein
MPPPKFKPPATVEFDVEQSANDTCYLKNSTVQSLIWSGITVTVPDRETRLSKQILTDVRGCVAAGENTHSLLFLDQDRLCLL